MPISVLDPVQEAVVARVAPAPRLSTLAGKTLGLYSNGKINANRLLELTEVELRKQFSFTVQWGTYDPANLMEEHAWVDIDKCDAIILTNGDCGACSSSGIANAIELEKRGIPTLLISTPPFFEAVKTLSELRGMPTVKWAVVDHPIASIGDNDLQARARSVAKQFLDIILSTTREASAA